MGVRAIHGETVEFPMILGLHQGSVLNLFLCIDYGQINCSYSGEGTWCNVVCR